MAQKVRGNKGKKSKNPSFPKASKMRRYDVIYDEDVQQNRAGFFDKTLYTIAQTRSASDSYWTVEPGYEHRIDLISKKFYNTSKYAWILEEINDIRDPIKDIVVGKKLLILSQSKIIAMV